MCNWFRSGIGIVCLGCSAAVFAQTYDDLADETTNCRAVVARANIDGTEQQIVGRACLQDDGTWQFVQSADGSVLWYPAADYPYADLGYWGRRFSSAQVWASCSSIASTTSITSSTSTGTIAASACRSAPAFTMARFLPALSATDSAACVRSAGSGFGGMRRH